MYESKDLDKDKNLSEEFFKELMYKRIKMLTNQDLPTYHRLLKILKRLNSRKPFFIFKGLLSYRS